MTQYKYDVTMSCGGCSGAVTKALTKLEGVDKFDVSLETQKVTVESSSLTEARLPLTRANQSEILAAIQKTGKTAKVTEQ
ncbi:Cytosolic copper metallochaperone [Mortierella sp. GBA35]|nr:Cytosolic copper metallochaperone [Mortierella sp. AD031]KAF9108714.1 Cytosolic copper metallochaperone [Mortierella sp. GBA35]